MSITNEQMEQQIQEHLAIKNVFAAEIEGFTEEGSGLGWYWPVNMPELRLAFKIPKNLYERPLTVEQLVGLQQMMYMKAIYVQIEKLPEMPDLVELISTHPMVSEARKTELVFANA